MTIWHPADCDNLAAPAKIRAVLGAALRAAPEEAALYVKLGNLNLDAYDYAAAAKAFEAALALGPVAGLVRIRLARSYNALRQHEAALAAMGEGPPEAERGIALQGLARTDAAEAELRAALDTMPENRRASTALSALLRDAGRAQDLLAMCEQLYARGVNHAQLFYEWGRALALTGDLERSRQMMFDPARVTVRKLPVPDGYPSLTAFNNALAEEILGSPDILKAFPQHEEANRGSSRVHNLLSGRNPAVIRTLLQSLQALVSACPTEPDGDFDPWPRARPAEAHLRPWGLIQRGGAYEEWHTHRGGWMSGVYYIRVPHGITDQGVGPGCLEYGPPTGLGLAVPGLVQPQRYVPVEGILVTAPSHYAHRTIPSGIDADRVSFAFDVVAH